MQTKRGARPRVALATYERAPDMAPDDRLLLPALDAAGADVECVVWSNRGVRWNAFDAVVLRSCWDYHLRITEFHGWLDVLESAHVRLFNSPALVRWNANKRYLIDLAQRGATTIETRLVSAGARASDVEPILSAESWQRAVIKPVVSASGYQTYAITLPLDLSDRERVERATSVGPTLLQPFADEVSRDGEFSFVFIDGAFSHAVIKRAGGGEFRVQAEHGGSADPIDPPRGLVDQAAALLALLPEMPLYARVDGIQRASAFILMELELIEPSLYFEHQIGSAERLARAIVRRIRNR